MSFFCRKLDIDFVSFSYQECFWDFRSSVEAENFGLDIAVGSPVQFFYLSNGISRCRCVFEENVIAKPVHVITSLDTHRELNRLVEVPQAKTMTIRWSLPPVEAAIHVKH